MTNFGSKHILGHYDMWKVTSYQSKTIEQLELDLELELELELELSG